MFANQFVRFGAKDDTSRAYSCQFENNCGFNNQLRGGSSSSLRTWNQNIVDNQLGYLCSLRRWINNQPAKLEKLDVADVDEAGKLRELAVTNEAFNELNELVVDNEAV